MESNDELKEIDIKNHTFYCLNDIMRFGYIYFDNILLDKKSYENSHENILIYDISYKTFMGAISLRIRFNKIDGFIKIYDGTRYLVLLLKCKISTISLVEKACIFVIFLTATVEISMECETQES